MGEIEGPDAGPPAAAVKRFAPARTLTSLIPWTFFRRGPGPPRVEVPVSGLGIAKSMPNVSEAVCCCFCCDDRDDRRGGGPSARNLFSTSLQITDEVGGYLLVALTFLQHVVRESHGGFHRSRWWADAVAAFVCASSPRPCST